MKRSTAHLVADARLRDDEVWVACTCGATVTADHAERANEAYQRHRTDDGSPRGETGVRHDGVHGRSWKKGGNDIFPIRSEAMREASRRYYNGNREAVLERRRTRYWARKAMAA